MSILSAPGLKNYENFSAVIIFLLEKRVMQIFVHIFSFGSWGSPSLSFSCVPRVVAQFFLYIKLPSLYSN